jgi:Tfp pilus assembly protein PilF
MLGAVLTQSGRNSEALKANQTAVALSPQDPESHYNLGNTLQKLGMLNEAEASYLNVISLKPNYAEVYNNYGNILLKLGRLGDAEENFKQAIELKPEYTEAQYNLGIVLHQLSKFDESIKHLKLAIKHNPNFIKGRISLSTVCNSAVPGWHIPMMNDKERNNAYAEAIKLAINDGAFVLDIGTGSGLLSMMAASSGAGKVITCETSKTIADVAKQIISCNGFEEKLVC